MGGGGGGGSHNRVGLGGLGGLGLGFGGCESASTPKARVTSVLQGFSTFDVHGPSMSASSEGLP